MIFCFSLIGCAHSNKDRNGPDVSSEAAAQKSLMKPVVEALFMNHKQLEYLHGDIHEVARELLFQSDRQLDYIQKAALYIKEAYLLGYAEWQLLSIMEYIKPDSLQDYLTLRRKGLTQSIPEIQYTIKQIELYRNFIQDKRADKIIRDAVGIIEGNIRLMGRLKEMVKNFSN
jgi:hypothetical protein